MKAESISLPQNQELRNNKCLSDIGCYNSYEFKKSSNFSLLIFFYSLILCFLFSFASFLLIFNFSPFLSPLLLTTQLTWGIYRSFCYSDKRQGPSNKEFIQQRRTRTNMEFKYATQVHEPVVSGGSGLTPWPLRFDTCPIHMRIRAG